MAKKKNEKIYDQELAPLLMQVGKRCQELGISFIACVEYDAKNQGIGRTEFMMPDEKGKLSASQRLTHWAARAKGNIDALFIICDRHGKKHGHSSVYLQMAGNKNIQYTGTETAAFTVTTP